MINMVFKFTYLHPPNANTIINLLREYVQFVRVLYLSVLVHALTKKRMNMAYVCV